MKRADIFVFICSKDYFNPGRFALKELKYAIDKNKNSELFKIIPLIIDDIGKIRQHINTYEDSDEKDQSLELLVEIQELQFYPEIPLGDRSEDWAVELDSLVNKINDKVVPDMRLKSFKIHLFERRVLGFIPLKFFHVYSILFWVMPS